MDRTYIYYEDVIDILGNKKLVHEENEFVGGEELFEMTRAKWRKIAGADKDIYSLYLIEREDGHDLKLEEKLDRVVVIRTLCVDDD